MEVPNFPTVVSIQMNNASNEGDIFYLEDYIEVHCSQDAAKTGIFEILAIVFGFAILITNTIVVIAILRGGRKLQKATFYCIGNLAIADLMAGLLLLWVFGLQKVVLPFRSANSELVQKSIWTITVWSSLLSQIVIAADRYSHVTRCTRQQSSRGVNTFKWGNTTRRKLVITGIALTWIIPCITFVIPVATFWNCRDSCACYVKGDNQDVIYMWCLPVDKCSQVNPSFTKSSMLFLGLVLLVMPFIPMILYFQIYLFVRKSSLKLHTSNSKSRSVDNYSQKESMISKESSSSLKNDVFSTDESVNGSIPARSNGVNFTSITRIGSIYKPKDSTKPSQKSVIPKRFSIRHFSKESDRHEINSRSHSSIDTEENIKRKPYSLSAAQRRNQNRDMKLLRTLVIILALFVISTVPLGLLFMLAYNVTDKRYLSAVKGMLTLSLFNSLLNPWVYFWRFREMRKAIRNLFCSCGYSKSTNNACMGAAFSSVDSNKKCDGKKCKSQWIKGNNSDTLSRAGKYTPSKEHMSSTSSAY